MAANPKVPSKSRGYNPEAGEDPPRTLCVAFLGNPLAIKATPHILNAGETSAA